MVDGTIFNIQNYKVNCLPRVILLKLKFISTVMQPLKKVDQHVLTWKAFRNVLTEKSKIENMYNKSLFILIYMQ